MESTVQPPEKTVAGCLATRCMHNTVSKPPKYRTKYWTLCHVQTLFEDQFTASPDVNSDYCNENMALSSSVITVQKFGGPNKVSAIV
jgi:hypothetical protein